MNPKAKEYSNTGLVQNSSPLYDLCEYFREDINGQIRFPGAPAWLLDASEAEASEMMADASSSHGRSSSYALYASIRNASMRVAR